MGRPLARSTADHRNASAEALFQSRLRGSAKQNKYGSAAKKIDIEEPFHLGKHCS
jgi:hypothetical protein